MCIGDGRRIGLITHLSADQSTPPTCERAYIQPELTELRQEGEQLVVFAVCCLVEADDEACMILSRGSGIGSVRFENGRRTFRQSARRALTNSRASFSGSPSHSSSDNASSMMRDGASCCAKRSTMVSYSARRGGTPS